MIEMLLKILLIFRKKSDDVILNFENLFVNTDLL